MEYVCSENVSKCGLLNLPREDKGKYMEYVCFETHITLSHPALSSTNSLFLYQGLDGVTNDESHHPDIKSNLAI